MSFRDLTTEQLREVSLIELTHKLMKERKEASSFKSIMDELISLLQLTDEEVKARISQFYTDLNIDGRFICVGENLWGLRTWYPFDQSEEELVPVAPVSRKKKKKADDDDDFDDLDFEDFEEEEEIDELVDFVEEEEEDIDEFGDEGLTITNEDELDDFEEEVEEEI